MLPTHNGSAYLRQSINSCLSQTHDDIELIVVVDGSTDATSDIVESYKDSRLNILRNKTNEGLPQSLNKGFSSATGDYLTWTSDDNFYCPEAIARLLAFIRCSGCDFAYSNYYRLTEKDGRMLNPIIITPPDSPNFKNGNSIGACFLYTRDVMIGTGEYDADAFLSEDYDYWIRVSRRFRMGHLNEALYYYRDNKEALSHRKRYQVRIASLLVMLKNHVVDYERASALYSREVAEPIWVSRNRLLARELFARRLGIRIAILKRRAYSKLSLEILRDFANGTISLPEARMRLSDLTQSIFAGLEL